MTTDIKELVKRLRATMNWGGSVGVRPINQDGPEAADAIEALAGEVERYRERHKEFMTLQNALERVCGERATLTAERDRLKAALQEQHNWHLSAGAIGLPDDKGGWIEIDNAAEYSDSELCSRTIAALGDAS